MKMYKLVYEYFYMGGDKVAAALAFFDDKEKALAAGEHSHYAHIREMQPYKEDSSPTIIVGKSLDKV